MPEPGDDEQELLAGVRDERLVFGHTHLAFRRTARIPEGDEVELVNPGSVGMPLDGDARAAWALLDHGKFEFRRSAYDVERAATKMRSHGDWAEPLARRIENGSD
jgi:predicted phosphodiesterase